MKLGDAKPQSRGEHSRLEDLLELVKLKGWTQIRILPHDIISYKQHWINILASKTKREVKIPKMCLSHNPIDDSSPLPVKCPYCEIESQGGVSYLVNVIVRSIQEDAPSKIRVTKAESASGFKDPNSESWTPVRVLRVTSTLMKKIIELKALNKHVIKGAKKTFDVNHERFGVDLNIKYDENAKGGDKYQINMAEKSPLTEELKYLVWELTEDLIVQMGRESLADAKKELGRMQIVGAEEFDGDDDDDSLGKKKKKPAAKKKGGDFFDGDEDDEDDEPAPKKKAPAKKRPVDEDEDDDDFDEDDEDDDEPAPKKKAPAKKPAPKKKPVDEDDDEDDDDFDDDDDDDDDEDDEPAPKKKAPAKAPAKKAPAKRSRDEDDDEDFDDEDDEDDEPASKKKAPAKKPVGKKAPPPDDDDEDFDDEDDDDEDDEPAPKRKAPAKKPAAKKAPAKKRSSRDEDDEDEDDDDVPF